MKNRVLFSLCVASFLICSCNKEELPQQPLKPATSTIMGVGSVHNGSIIVKLGEGKQVQTKSLDASLPDIGIYSIEPLYPENPRYAERRRKAGLDRWHIIRFNPETPVTKAHNEISKIGFADIVEYMPVVRSAQASTPFNDPYLGSQWHYYNNSGKGDINLQKAWEISTGKESVIVAVLDAGVDYKHDDLKDAMWVNVAEKNGATGADDDNNGYVDDIYGYNFTATGNDMTGIIVPEDHGTHVAGTIGAINNNGKFGAGIAGGNGTTKGARIMTCQTIEGNKGAYIGLAFVYAAENGAVISQNSWSIEQDSKSINEAIDYFNTYAGMDEAGVHQVGPMAGGVSIFAAGNENATIGYPAYYDGVIAVSAVGPNGVKASYSNYGAWVDIAAPGGDGGGNSAVFSTLPNNQFGSMQGTSMACPHVSGVAALIVSKYGGQGFTNTMLKQRLLQSADEDKLYKYNTQYKNNKWLGVGLLDAYAALMPASVPDPVASTSIEASVVSNIITLTWEATANGKYNTYGYNIFFSKNDISDLNESNIANNSNVSKVFVRADDIAPGESVTKSITASFNSNIYIRIQAVNNFGDGSLLSKQIEVRTLTNNAPVFDPAGSMEVSLRSFDKQEYEFTVSDPDGHKVNQCKFEGGSDAATHSQTGNKVTVEIDAKKAVPGTYKATLSASDEYGAITSIDITYTILPNTPPAVIKGLENMVFGKGESITVNLTEHFKDADGEKLSYTIESSESVVTDYGLVDNTLTLSGRTFGTTQITITAMDAQKEKAATSFTVLVRDKKVPADIYPNPARDYVYVRAGADGNYSVTITSAQGGEVFSNTSVAAGPFNPYKVDATSWDAGVYTVVLKGNGSEYKTTVVKL